LRKMLVGAPYAKDYHSATYDCMNYIKS